MLLQTPARPLLGNLVRVTAAACEHLEAGVAATDLFGSRVDAEKFTEAMTAYALTGAAVQLSGGGNPDAKSSLETWCRGLCAASPSHSLDAAVAEVVVRELVQTAVCPRGRGSALGGVGQLLGSLAQCKTAEDILALVQ